MYCPLCGSDNENNAQYCKGCGTRFEHIEVPVPVNVTGKVKAFISAPIVLILCVLFTLNVLAGLCYNLITAGNTLNSALTELQTIGGLDVSFYGMSNSAVVVLVIIGSIPSILIAVGLWLMYADGRRADLRTSGITMIRGVVIFYLVMTSIFTGIIVLFGFICFIAGGFGDILVLSIFLMIITVSLLICVLILMFFAKVLITLKTVRDTLNTGFPSEAVSVFVAVICYIYGTLTAIGAISDLFVSPVMFAMGAVSAACYILFGVLIFSYRDKMRQYFNNFVPPAEICSQYENNNYNNIGD